MILSFNLSVRNVLCKKGEINNCSFLKMTSNSSNVQNTMLCKVYRTYSGPNKGGSRIAT
jgi:hypothetical protein